MKQFGIRTDGLEEIFENIFKDYFSSGSVENFKYLEIGAAGCQSFKSFYELIEENCNVDYHAYGLDLVAGWSLDWRHIGNFGHPIQIFSDDPKQNSFAFSAKASLFLKNNPREWISSFFEDGAIDICFIDGCHGSKCVIKDFEVVSPKIKQGGLVMFHDSGEAETGTDWQGHCEEYINVRKAILDLGLDGSNSDWSFLMDIKGSRTHGGDGNGLWVVRKK